MRSVASESGVLEAIGHTPLIRLLHTPPDSAEIWLKLEAANPTGSAKDRIALRMIEGAEQRGGLQAGYRVVEASGGSTGTALAMVSAAKGYDCTIVTSDAFAPQKLQAMRALGADLVMVQSETGMQSDPRVMEAMRARAEELGRAPRTLFVDQHTNPDNPAGYRAMAHEIMATLAGDFDAFVMACGSGGCFSGNASVFRKELGSRVRCVAVEAAGYRHLSGGPPGAHHIDGISDGPPLPIMRMDLVDETLAVRDDEAYEQARLLARREGLLVGASTGANVAAAHRIAADLGPTRRVVTVACDSGLKYLQGPLFAPTRSGAAG